jgi:hypothetical protein
MTECCKKTQPHYCGTVTECCKKTTSLLQYHDPRIDQWRSYNFFWPPGRAITTTSHNRNCELKKNLILLLNFGSFGSKIKKKKEFAERRKLAFFPFRIFSSPLILSSV